MKKIQKVLLFTKGLEGEGVSTMSLGPVIDDAVHTVTKDDFFFTHILRTSAKGVQVFLLFYTGGLVVT